MRSPYFGSGLILRLGTSRRRGILHLCKLARALGAVLTATLASAVDTGGVERAAHDVITNARQVLDSSAADEHDGVLLQIVADTRDVGGDLELVRQADPRHFAES